MPIFDPVEYKLNSKTNWNTVAPQYHDNWANAHVGPFKSTSELVRIAEINSADRVLDIACGTGAVSHQVIRHLGREGMLVGVDLSRTALSIAKKFVNSNNAHFFEMDAEKMGFRIIFDKILCQYGLMFFPNVGHVLATAKKMLSRKGKLVIAVHGTADEVPYFSSIMKPILKYIPDIRPKGAPTVHRFGNPSDLERELGGAGFTDITTTRHVFSYEAGTFDEYWEDYIHSTANAIRSRIESMGSNIVSSIRKESEQNSSRYIKDGRIVFPWTVLITSAS